MKTIHKFHLMLLLLIVMGGGKSLAQTTPDGSCRIWAIFDTLATHSSTWNGVRAYDDFESKMSSSRNTGWVYRAHAFKRIEALNSEEIMVNGKKLFPGLYFTAPKNTYTAIGNETNYNDENYRDTKNIGSFELSPKEYRILLNPSSDTNRDAYFEIKDVPEGSYIWIEAITNHSNPQDSGDGLNFQVQTTYYTWTGYYQTYDAPRRDRSSDPTETDKHIFSYYAGYGGTYKIAPSRACYIYFIAVMDHPLPVIDFSVASDNDNKQTAWIDIRSGNIGPFSNAPTITINNADETSINPQLANKLNFTSDDETVVKVDNWGNITGVGRGTATITATLPAGTTYNYWNGNLVYRQYTLEHPCYASFTVRVDDSEVYTTKGLTQNKDTLKVFQQIDFYKDDDTKSNDISLYIGGWKYQNNSVLANLYNATTKSYVYGNGSSRYDHWNVAKNYSVGRESPKDYQSVPIDGYDIYSLGQENGKCEFLYRDKLLAGDYVIDFETRQGERKPMDSATSVDNTNGKGNPFTVPCFGSFFKIEPERNGLLTLYILQNGTIDFDSDRNNLVNTINWRPLYIVDEAGNRLLSKDVKAVTKQRTVVSNGDVTSDVYDSKGNLIYNSKEGRASTYMEAIQDYVDSNTGNIWDIHSGVYNKYWHRRGSSEIVLDPDITGDGWLLISKGYTKYQFEVKAGKSYYVFANKSAIGFCGAMFLPYATPTGNYTISDDGTGDKLENILQGQESATIKSVTVKNKNGFHKGWNSICLPFSVTESKMREIFGKKESGTAKEDYEVVLFNGCTDSDEMIGDSRYDKAHFFHHVYQDIVAGYPYMIWIPDGADIIDKTSFTVNNVTIEKESVNNRPTISTSKQYMPAGSGFEDHSTIDDFTFTGVYNPTSIPKDSYCIVQSGIQVYDAVTLPGYRAYLHPSYKEKNNSNYVVKRIAATNLNELNDIWDEANPIKSIFADEKTGNSFSAQSDVYNVSGQLVRKNSTSLDGLPKGIYIVNGKKYIVK